MCGIFAYAGDRKVDARAALERLRHRGPDHVGNLARGKVSLGHCRLSIIDTSDRSNQPMESISERLAIVFNGEIYNYRELRQELSQAGVSFRTEGDTEIILAGYEMHGTAFFDRLRGMWSFVIHDRGTDELIAARDPFGIKPLYYYAPKEGVVCFASEIRAFEGIASLEPNPAAYAVFYNLGYFLAPSTPYKNIWKLRPGEVISRKLSSHDAPSTRRIPRFAGTARVVSRTEAVDVLERTLMDSVKAHYVADVPVSILLSGGNDSSLIAALSKEIGQRPVAYHVAIEGSEDTRYAEAVAKHLGIELVVERLDQAALTRQYERVWEILDEPTGDTSIIPTSLVYERIKGRAKVVLSGEGGDELFGGYRRHRLLSRHSRVKRRSVVNSVFNSLVSPKAAALSSWNPLVQRTRAALLAAGFPDDLIGAYVRGTRLIDFPLQDDVLRDKLYDLYQSERERETEPPLAFDTLAYLPNDLLMKSDIASMASSIEARVPFVDRWVASTAAACLAGYGGSDGDKRILKEVLARYLPGEFVYRNKSGFGVPMRVYDMRIFDEDFHRACAFHLEHREAFGVSDEMSQLIRNKEARLVIARKFPRFAFALISNWKLFTKRAGRA